MPSTAEVKTNRGFTNINQAIGLRFGTENIQPTALSSLRKCNTESNITWLGVLVFTQPKRSVIILSQVILFSDVDPNIYAEL